jgi:hypothetical protein
MDLIITLFAVTAGLLVADIAAMTFGVDSRDQLADDHQR